MENGNEAEQKRQLEFFDLAERFQGERDPDLAKNLGDQLGRMSSVVDAKNRRTCRGGWWPLMTDSVLEPFIRFRPDLVDVGRAASGKLQMVGRIPRPGRKLQGFTLPVGLYVAPQNVNGVGGARLVFSPGEPVEFVGQFLWYLDYARHGFLGEAPRWVSRLDASTEIKTLASEALRRQWRKFQRTLRHRLEESHNLRLRPGWL
jgi:hypothetical protein